MIKRTVVLGISLAVRAFDVVRYAAGRLAGRPPARCGVVLYYHAIKPHQRARFAAQMDQVLQRAHPFPAGAPEQMLAGARNVAVTFDDGFLSVIENAAPELAKRRIPFTLFVPSGCLGERPSWVRDPKHPSWTERVLTPTELRALAGNSLATLGSHSITHPDFLKLDPVRAEQELQRSKADLQTIAGIDIDLFSFPHGRCSEALLDQARLAGYRLVFTIEPSMIEAGAFTVGRVAVDPDDWRSEFRLKLAGAYRWRSHLRRLRPAA